MFYFSLKNAPGPKLGTIRDMFFQPIDMIRIVSTSLLNSNQALSVKGPEGEGKKNC